MVVRYEGSYDDVLPERRVLGYREARTGAGMPVRVRVPDFPIATPLRRLDVGLVGSVEVAPSAPRAIPGPQPIRGLEPL